MDPPTTGREPRPPSHVSAAATCHALPGLGSVMERSLSVGEGKGARELHGVEVTQQSRSSLGPDLKVWSGSLKKGMHCPAPKRPEPPRVRPSPQARKRQFGEGKAQQLGRKVAVPQNLLIHSAGESAVSECAFCPPPSPHRWRWSDQFAICCPCCLCPSALCQ